jgi:hypothetical protein
MPSAESRSAIVREILRYRDAETPSGRHIAWVFLEEQLTYQSWKTVSEPGSMAESTRAEFAVQFRSKTTFTPYYFYGSNESVSGVIIVHREFQGVKLGTPLAALEQKFGKKLHKAVMKTGEGDFDYYSLRNETGQEIAQFFLSDDKRVRMIETNSPLWKTTKGIHVGSTVRELRAAYPNLEIHGSEIESRTSASSPATKWSFRIDAYFGSYELSPKELASISPETKILALFCSRKS